MPSILVSYELLQNHERTSEQLIYLNALISKKRRGNLVFGEIYEFIRLTLKAWIEEQGRYIMSDEVLFSASHKNMQLYILSV